MNPKEPPVGLVFTSFKKQGRIPQWAQGYSASRDTFTKALATPKRSEVIVLHETSVSSYLSLKQEIRNCLIENMSSALKMNFVLSVEKSKQDKFDSVSQLMDIFPDPYLLQVEISLGKDNLEASVAEAFAKHVRLQRNPLLDSSILSEIQASLQSERGRLCASKIAKAMGIPLAELASYLGLQRQTVSKTPDAKRLQPSLRPFQRIIGLRATLSEEKFKKWLHQTFPDLDGKTPLEAIAEGHIEAIADFAEDAILGTPS